MTFHLTENEKRDIINAMNNPNNQENIKRLQEHFKDY